jgi:hypothetical protein
MAAYIDGFVVGKFRNRPLIAPLAQPDASGALVTAKRFTDASRSTALPDKLAGFIYRLGEEQGYLGYAVTAQHRQLRCRELGGFGSDNAAKQAIVDEYGKRDGHPLVK